MKYKLLIALIVFINTSFYAQEVAKIEFHHSNSIIIFSSIDISFEPIKNNKKDRIKIRVKKGREEEYSSEISKTRFLKIYNACLKIENDTVAVKDNLIDGSSTHIILYDNLSNKKNYYASGLAKKSQEDKFQKDFWSVTLLIIKAAGLEMKDLADY
ncbi:hypothetical protein CLU96_4830 [Chryseobacterium sp. 52]|uniref:hypothetical protein n=1 Tax=Chryseobacterium sp. 52 TaxID=2035213 RepID=UPI000C1A4E55|nr:hypothetical protein [Chryseobacterium sp. 52]PIF47761.1 hypothetical protein CLU96_4830 [Chryseobacterium sp. 52]